MRRSTAFLSLVLASVLACILAAGALAADQVLKLRNGDLIPGTVVKVDDRGVTFDPAKGGRMQVPWNKVHPINRYELWKATLEPDDVEGRVELATWCLSSDLFVYARREIAAARGLGHEKPAALDELLAEVNGTEADQALADVDRLIAEGKLEDALKRVRVYVRDAVDEKNSARVRKRVPDIVARIEHRDATDKERKAIEKKERAAAKRKKWVDKYLTQAAQKKAKASEQAIEAFAYLAKGNQTRSRARLSKAEKEYQGARTIYKRVRKVEGATETGEFCLREMKDCDRRTVEVLARWGSLEVDNKAWKKANAVVDRGLRIDPVHRELLELRKTIDENWIRRRLSDITGARGHSSNR